MDMKISGYKNYIFDFYGTLCNIWTNEKKRYLWENLSEVFRSQKADYHAGQLQKKYLSLCRQETERMQDEKQYDLIEIDLLKVFESLYLEKGITVSEETLKETMVIFRLLSLEYMNVFKGVRELLTQLRNDGCRVYLLSNAQSVFTEYEMERMSLKQYFDGICYSSDAGYRKPSERFFDRLFEQYGLNKDESIMIGNDLYSDIKAAHKYGLASVYIKTIQSSKGNAVLPDDALRVRDIEELLELYLKDKEKGA
ncbi:MAG: HAD family hydrolase [Erysipelotrichaceae bacterium]|nr:HAD family hydrolase [Erysipelotrichaceae bacterium]